MVGQDLIASDPNYDPGCDLREIEEEGGFNYDCYLNQIPLNRQNINSIDYKFKSIHSVKESIDSLALSGNAKMSMAKTGMDATLEASGGFLNEKINYEKKTTINIEFSYTSHVFSIDHNNIMKPSTSMYQSAVDAGATHFIRDIVYGGKLSVKITFNKDDSSEKKVGKFIGALSVVTGTELKAEGEGETPAENGGEAPSAEGAARKKRSTRPKPTCTYTDELRFKKGQKDEYLTLY